MSTSPQQVGCPQGPVGDKTSHNRCNIARQPGAGHTPGIRRRCPASSSGWAAGMRGVVGRAGGACAKGLGDSRPSRSSSACPAGAGRHRPSSYPLRSRYTTGCSRCLLLGCRRCPEGRLGLGWWYPAAVGVQAPVVPPSCPGSRFSLQVCGISPRAEIVHQFGFVQAIYRFRQRVVIGIPFRTNGNYGVLLCEALCVTNGQVLHTAVGAKPDPA